MAIQRFQSGDRIKIKSSVIPNIKGRIGTIIHFHPTVKDSILIRLDDTATYQSKDLYCSTADVELLVTKRQPIAIGLRIKATPLNYFSGGAEVTGIYTAPGLFCVLQKSHVHVIYDSNPLKEFEYPDATFWMNFDPETPVTELDDLFSDEELDALDKIFDNFKPDEISYISCPRCGSQAPKKADGYICPKCQCDTRYLKPIDGNHKHDYWVYRGAGECMDESCKDRLSFRRLDKDPLPDKCRNNGCRVVASSKGLINWHCKKCFSSYLGT